MKIQPDSTLVVVGDSITACQRVYPDNPEGMPVDLGKGYVSFVDGLLTACYPSHHIRVLNRGVSGDTVRELKARWQADVLNLKPDWLSICIGINDVWQQFDGKHEGQSHVTLSEYESTLGALLVTARPILTGLVLMTPYFILPHGEPMRTMMDMYGTAVWRLAQRHQAIFVNTQAVFDSAVEHVPVETLARDCAHLAIPGHMILARAILQSVGFEWSGK
jgi:lysophospholipase L1-like esterase